MTTLRIYVPAPNTPFSKYVSPGAGIVGLRNADGSALVYYEGNIYDAINLHTMEERLICAADRLVMRYPTIAMGRVPLGELLDVGVFRWSDDGVHSIEINDIETMQEWEKRYQRRSE